MEGLPFSSYTQREHTQDFSMPAPDKIPGGYPPPPQAPRYLNFSMPPPGNLLGGYLRPPEAPRHEDFSMSAPEKAQEALRETLSVSPVVVVPPPPVHTVETSLENPAYFQNTVEPFSPLHLLPEVLKEKEADPPPVFSLPPPAIPPVSQEEQTAPPPLPVPFRESDDAVTPPALSKQEEAPHPDYLPPVSPAPGVFRQYPESKQANGHPPPEPAGAQVAGPTTVPSKPAVGADASFADWIFRHAKVLIWTIGSAVLLVVLFVVLDMLGVFFGNPTPSKDTPGTSVGKTLPGAGENPQQHEAGGVQDVYALTFVAAKIQTEKGSPVNMR